MRFALCLTVDRHGLRPCDDKVCKISEWHRYNTIFVIARKEQSEGRGNPSCLERTRTVCLFAYWFTVARHELPGLAMTRWVKDAFLIRK